MKIEDNFKYGYINNTRNNNINFGFSVTPGFVVKARRTSSRGFKNLCGEISGMTGLNKDDVFELIASAPKKKVSFLHSLANRYNSKYYYTPEANREDPKHLIELYKQIKRPKKDDFYIISSIHGTFKNLQDVFKQIKTKKDMDFVRTLQKNNIIRDSKASTTFIIDMLKSSNKKEYLKNFPEYLAYIKLNIHDADAIKKLDSMLDNKTFNAKKYNTEYALRQTINNIRYNDSVLLNMANLEKYYTPEGSKILNRFLNDYLLFREVPSIKNIEQDLLNIYGTTTKKNIKDRINLLEKIKYTSASKSEKIKDKEEVKELKLLFDRMDGSKYAKNFVRKAINSHLKIDSVRELNQILEITSPKEADIYFNNIKRMVENSSLEERETAIINGLNNPLYEPPRLKNKKKMAKMYHYTSKIGPSKTSRIAEHLKCTIIYNIMPKGPQTKDIPLSKNLNNLIITLHTDSTTNAVSAKPAKINLISIPLSEKPLPIETPSINLLSKLKESPKAKRLRVINDVNNLISEKLKKSQLDKQQDLYAKNATAMRLKLLPEIFNSIKETRAVDRAVNKKKSASSNNDALTLYSKINGKNRKLIKYMLQKRNSDKTRMFEVKDIIAFIEKTENQIQKRKAINTNFKAADEKAYYNHIYDSFVQQYGKPNLARKTTTGAKNIIYDGTNNFLRKDSRESLTNRSGRKVNVEKDRVKIKNSDGNELLTPKKVIYDDANKALKKASEQY